MNQTELLTVKKYLNSMVDESSALLRSFPTNEMGLTMEEAKTDEYYRAKAQCEKDMTALRRFNARYAKQLKEVQLAARYRHLKDDVS